MQGAFAFGLAKNVNGLPGARRAATAYQISGRLSSPSTPVNGDGASSSGSAAFSGWSGSDVDALEESSPQLAAAVATIPRVASSPIAFADLAREHTPLATSASPSNAVPVSSSAASSVDEALLYAVGEEQHLGKRGTSVDKTNPFIGYFQTSTEEDGEEQKATPKAATASPLPPLASPAPMRRVPCRTQSSATLSSAASTATATTSFYPSVFFPPQKTMPEWLQTSRFPAFFKQPGDAGSRQRAKQDKHKQDDKKSAQAFLNALKLEASALSVQKTDLADSSSEQQDRKYAFKRTLSMPAVSAAATAPAVAPVKKQATALPTSSTMSSSSSTSRFEQDFDVVGSLGQGGQGAVFKVRSKVDGCYYAIKKVVLPRASAHDSERAESQALREVRSMASMSPHANVVRYHTAWTEINPDVEESTSSTESIRGSDAPSLENSAGQQEMLHRQQLELLDEEEELRMSEAQDTSFSLDFSSDSLAFDDTYSTPGFSFEDEMSETVGLGVDEEVSFGRPGDLKKQVASRTAEEKPVALKSQVNLYIQMELCGMSVAPASTSTSSSATSTEEPFHRFLDQLKADEEQEQQQQQSDGEPPSNLAAWLRSSLDDRSSWSRTSPTHLEGLKLFLGVVQGVAHMHSYGVIHRDLKPDNIFIQGDVAKIGDFGLSKSAFADNAAIDEDNNGMKSPRERLQELGRSDEYGDHTTALGTFTYASPEQLGYRFSSSNALKNAASRLKSAKYSIKSDIFALGVILLELCCPFSTMMERSQVLTAVRHGVVPQKARQNFPDEMDLVLRMTAIDPTDRPTSEEVCEQLQQLLASSSSSAAVSPQSALEDLRELQLKLAAAVRQVRDRSQATLQLEALVSELNDKVQNVGIAFA